MIVPPHTPRLLAGPALEAGPEPLDAHIRRLGALPAGAERLVIDELEASGLLGRGGAGFPVGRKWRAIADRRGAPAVVVANGAEGEPASEKDRTLMAARPHLVIDGAELAAAAVGADRIVFYVGREHAAAVEAMSRAMAVREADSPYRMRLVTAPISYVAGEATAAVHYIESGDARPTMTPPRMSERGVDGRPTLVQNVESLAYAALIGRYGAAWYRTAGRRGSPGTALMTVAGSVRRPGVHEVELGSTVGEVVAATGGPSEEVAGVLMGGYFGTWARPEAVWHLPLDPGVLAANGLTFGCGLLGLLPASSCGVRSTSSIVSFLARSSARQCGPCLYGLEAIAGTMERVAACEADAADIERIERWAGQVAGRGACRHPDGAIQLLTSALDVFGDDVASHASRGRCAAAASSEAAGSNEAVA